MTSPRARFELEVDTAEHIATAVQNLGGIADLDGGRFGEVSKYFPKRRITGLRTPSPADDSHLEIHVIADISAGVPLPELGEKVRATAMHVCPELKQIDVVFSDALSGTETDTSDSEKSRTETQSA